jgi:hypothetical protein
LQTPSAKTLFRPFVGELPLRKQIAPNDFLQVLPNIVSQALSPAEPKKFCGDFQDSAFRVVGRVFRPRIALEKRFAGALPQLQASTSIRYQTGIIG